MHVLKFGAVACAATLGLTAFAAAETVEEACLAEAADEGYDAAGCSCLQEYADGSPGLGDELLALRDEANYEARRAAASEKALEAFDACYPISEDESQA